MKMYGLAFAALLLTVSCDRKKEEQSAESKQDSIPKIAKVKTPEKKQQPFFTMVGTEPFWNIEVTKDSLYYSTPDKAQDFRIKYEEIAQKNAQKMVFEGKDDNRSISVSIYKENCSDGMSDRNHSNTVTVSLMEKSATTPTVLKGCGNFTIDNELDGKWLVVEMAGQKLRAENLKDQKLPEVIFTIKERRFSAYAGCNRMGGELNPSRESFSFENIAATEMMCENIKIEESLLQALNSTKKIERREDRLYLLDFDGTKAVLARE